MRKLPGLTSANTARDVLAALAGFEWWEARQETCPPSQTPAVETLADWLTECPRQAWSSVWEASQALQVGKAPPFLLQPAREAARGAPDIFRIQQGTTTEGNPIRVPWTFVPKPTRQSLIRSDVETLHDRWLRAGLSADAHPLRPLIAAWQQRPAPTDPDRKGNGILPQSLSSVRGIHLVEHAPDQGELPDTSGPLTARPEQGWLPGMEPPPSKLVPALPLLAFDLGGGISLAKGRGAPVALRLFTEALLMVPLGARCGAVRIERTARELIAELWPNQRPRWRGMRGKGTVLRNALYAVHTAMVPYDGDYWVPIVVRRWPSGLDGTAIFDVEMPGNSDRGPLVHKPTLRLQGVRSAPAYRAYLGLCALRNRYATHKGRILPAKVPEVLRDRSGALLDSLRRIVLGRGGSPVKHWNDPRAVRTGVYLSNEEMWRRLPWLDDRDLVALCYPDIPRGTASWRKALQRSKATLLQLQSEELVEVRREFPRGAAAGARRPDLQGRWKIALTDHHVTP